MLSGVRCCPREWVGTHSVDFFDNQGGILLQVADETDPTQC